MSLLQAAKEGSWALVLSDHGVAAADGGSGETAAGVLITGLV
jgi:hypothetical protein